MAGAGGSSWIPKDMLNKPSLGVLAIGPITRTNNEAELLALLQGMKILANKDLSKVTIFRDSQHVIYKMINGYTTGSIKCHHLHNKITPLMSKCYELFHILSTNNSAADALANMGASLPQGQFCLNGQVPHLKPIP